jgi:hypothetical protein
MGPTGSLSRADSGRHSNESFRSRVSLLGCLDSGSASVRSSYSFFTVVGRERGACCIVHEANCAVNRSRGKLYGESFNRRHSSFVLRMFRLHEGSESFVALTSESLTLNDSYITDTSLH